MPLPCTKCPEAWLMDGAQRETPRGPGACKPPPAHISLLLSAPALRPTFFPVIQQSRLMSTSSALCLDLCLTHSSSSRSPCHFLGVAALDHPVWSASSLSTLHHAFFSWQHLLMFAWLPFISSSSHLSSLWDLSSVLGEHCLPSAFALYPGG